MFGLLYVLKLEPTVFSMAERLAASYKGAYWQFNALSNGGFYMSPRSKALFSVNCENGFEGQMSADALGITACLYSYSHLSFGDGEFAQRCGQHYHLLRDWAMAHVEAGAILRAID
ncbi:MAG: antirestriction protein [Burkholderiales bacterium]|nr:antirestriction protein [Burkholderiales bacterium]